MTKRTTPLPMAALAIGLLSLMACNSTPPELLSADDKLRLAETLRLDPEARSNAEQNAMLKRQLEKMAETKEAQDICAEFSTMKVCKDFSSDSCTARDVVSCFSDRSWANKPGVIIEIPPYHDCGIPSFAKQYPKEAGLMEWAMTMVEMIKPVEVATTPEAEKAATEVASFLAGILEGVKTIDKAQGKNTKLSDQDRNELAAIENTFFAGVVDAKRKQEISAGTIALFNLTLKAAQVQRAKALAANAAECEGYKKEGKKHLPHWCLTPPGSPKPETVPGSEEPKPPEQK